MHKQYMEAALDEANKAYELDEVPVGAIIVHNGEIISKGYNMRETLNDPLAHAEMIAIKKASVYLSTWKLNECILYVTIEPCIMCAGSIIQSRIGTVVYGAKDNKGGSFGSTVNLNDIEGYNHYPNIISGIMEDETSQILSKFFKEKRIMQIKISVVNNQEDFEEVKNLRNEVFVKEQKVDPDIEFDDYDDLNRDDVIHIVAKQNNEVVASLRLLLEKNKKIIVGRVVVKETHRKQGIGLKIMNYAEKYAFNNGYKLLELGAQTYALPFYENCGYTAFGDIFLDANIEHRMMRKEI